MSVQVIVCDACGRMASECECMVEFHKHGMTLHLCDECIDKAKEMVDEARKEGGDDLRKG